MNHPGRATAVASLTVALVLTALVGCARKAQPGAGGQGSPSASPSASATVPGPTPSAVTSPSPTATAPHTTAPGGTTVVSARVAYPWRWPDPAATVTHSYPVPPLPQLVRIGIGDHPRDPGERPYNRMSFTFTTAFPSYQIQFVERLTGDATGQPVPLEGLGALKVTFRQAQAHTTDGRSSVVAQPPSHLGLTRMVSYANAGDFEGVLTYGIGIGWPIPQSNPQIAVRVYEVELVTGQGQHQYVVAVDVDATQPNTQRG